MASQDDVVLLNVEDGIARIRFNRPAALNAIDEAVARGFLSACEAVSQQSDLRVVVLSGAGRAFMAGGDVRKMREAGADAAPLVDALLGFLNPALNVRMMSNGNLGHTRFQVSTLRRFETRVLLGEILTRVAMIGKSFPGRFGERGVCTTVGIPPNLACSQFERD